MGNPAPDSFARTCKAHTSKLEIEHHFMDGMFHFHGFHRDLDGIGLPVVDHSCCFEVLGSSDHCERGNFARSQDEPSAYFLYKVTRNHKPEVQMHIQLASLRPAKMG